MKNRRLLTISSLLLTLAIIAGVVVYSIHGISLEYAGLDTEEIMILKELEAVYGSNTTTSNAPKVSCAPRGGRVLPGSTITITATDPDGDNIKKIVYYWDEDMSNGNERTYLSDMKSTQTIEITAPQTAGEHLLYVYASDVNGNVSSWLYEPYFVVTENASVVDTTKPEIDLENSTIPEDGTVVALGQKITVAAKDPESGIYYIGYKWTKEGETKSYTIVYHPAGNKIEIEAPTDGDTYTLRVYCANTTFDTTRNVFTTSSAIKRTYNVKDTVKPTIVSIDDSEFTMAAGSEIPSSETLTSKVTATDNLTATEDLTITVDTSAIDPDKAGVYEIVFTVTDDAGNSVSEARNFEVTRIELDLSDIDLGTINTTEGAVELVDEGDLNLPEGSGAVTIKYVLNNTEYSEPEEAGLYTIVLSVADGDKYSAAGPEEIGYLRIKKTLTADDVSVTNNAYSYAQNTVRSATVTIPENAGELTVAYYDGENLVESPVEAKEYTIKVTTTGGDLYNAIEDLVVGTLTISKNETTVITIDETKFADIEVGSEIPVFTAEAEDENGEELTVSIDTSDVDMTTVGEYEVVFTAEDANHTLVTETRTLNVVDTTIPVITVDDENNIYSIEVHSEKPEFLASVSDNYDDDLEVVITDNIVVDTVGTYEVKFNAVDTNGNVAEEVTRTFTVVDTTKPVITVDDENNIYSIEVHGEKPEFAAVVTDNYDDYLEVVITDDINVDVVGTYTVHFNAVDTNGNVAEEVTRTFTVVDTTIPVITVDDENNVYTIEVHGEKPEFTASVTDNYDDDLEVVITDNIVVDTVGTYEVKFNAVDTNGNVAEEVTRTFTVVDTTKPVITLVGNSTVHVEVNTEYVDAGVTVTDNYDEDIEDSLVTVNPVDVTTLNTYTITYNVTDSNGNVADQVTRTVIVEDTTAPVITLKDTGVTVVGFGTTFGRDEALSLVEVSDNYDDEETLLPLVGVTFKFEGNEVSTIDTNDVKDYEIEYSLTDTEGNVATVVTKNITIGKLDLTASDITITADSTVYTGSAKVLEITKPEKAGTVTISKITKVVGEDEEEVTSIIDAGTYNVYVTAEAGDWYNELDEEILADTITIEKDNTVVITPDENNVYSIEVGSEKPEFAATAEDENGNAIALANIIITDDINVDVVGTYTITYKASDANHEEKTLTESFTVVDTTKPEIELVGDDEITLEVLVESYEELGATATDNYDGDITDSIVIGGDVVDTTVVDDYVVTYDVTDANGNVATQVTRLVHVVDTTKPVITLTGDAEITLEAKVDTYEELEATALDNYDGDITDLIIIDNTAVDTDTVGVYTVTYNVTDANGNVAEEVTRTVRVLDTTAPLITLTGSEEVTIEVGTEYVDAGAEAYDLVDGDLTAQIVTYNSVDKDVVDDYVVTYNVTDENGNIADEVTRIVHVVDTTKPVITLTGEAEITLEAKVDTYVEEGATATDNYDSDESITNAIVIGGDEVNVNVIGDYTVTYNVTDENGNVADEVIRTVHVVDTTAPVITLEGDSEVTIEVGSEYVDAGATAEDIYDGDLTDEIVTVNPVNKDIVDDYVVTYNVTDANGNVAEEVTRLVHVVDTTKPVITLTGDEEIILEAKVDTYEELGATALDNYDGDITSEIVVGGDVVDTDTVGEYVVTYNVTDANGNVADEVTRTVRVLDTTKPLITLAGLEEVTIEVGTEYVDAGAEAYDLVDGDITSEIVTVNLVNKDVVADYVVTYNVTDENGNVADEVIRTVHVVDTTKPILALVGSNNVVLEAKVDTYIEKGAVASDNYDDNLVLTASIVIGGDEVNVNEVGTYVVTYNVTDANGNVADEITRTVVVQDTLKPEITLIGDDDVTIEVGTEYVDAGATAEDIYDGDITDEISVNSDVDKDVVGDYTVTYNVTDANGNVADEVTRTVHVVDTTKPVITLTGDEEIILEAKVDTYEELGATALDNYDGDITSEIVIGGDVVDTDTVGEYVVTYNVTDANGNDAVEVTRTVRVLDTTKPLITLAGLEEVTIEVGTEYVDAGAEAYDLVDGDITSEIETVNPVNISVVDDYVVTYNVTDENGNVADEVTRTVHVVDTTKPVITINGLETVVIEKDNNYVDAGATATDNYDDEESITNAIVVSNEVDTSVVGDYEVTYNVEDANGNVADEVIRTVKVVDVEVSVENATYDRSAKDIIVTQNNMDVDAENITVEPETVTTAGTHDVTVTVVYDENTTLTFNKEITIEKALFDVSEISFVGDTEVTYDQDEHILTLTGNDDSEVDATITYTKAGVEVDAPVNAGTYVVVAEFTLVDTDNFSGFKDNLNMIAENIVINKAPYPVEMLDDIEYNATFDYNGSLQYASVVEDTLPTGLYEVIPELSANSIREVGTHNMTVTFTVPEDSNYIAPDAIEVPITVNPVDPTITAELTGNINEDGKSNITNVAPILNVTVLGVNNEDLKSSGTLEYVSSDETVATVDENGVITLLAQGETTITVSYSNNANYNDAETEVTLIVADTEAPVITLIGDSEITIEATTEAYVDEGVTVSDNVTAEATLETHISRNGTVNTLVPGTYTITYKVTDEAGNVSATVTRTVIVEDTTGPEITVDSNNVYSMEVNGEVPVFAATAEDIVDGEVEVTITNNIVRTVVGEYKVTFTATDAEGNESVVEKTFNVVDTQKPVIDASANIWSMDVDSEIPEFTAVVTDNYDEDLEAVITHDIDPEVAGTYTVTFIATDSSNNTQIVEKTFTVKKIKLTKKMLTVKVDGTSIADQDVFAYNNAVRTITIEAPEGTGTATYEYYKGSTEITADDIKDIGNYKVAATIEEGDKYTALAPTVIGKFSIEKAEPQVTATLSSYTADNNTKVAPELIVEITGNDGVVDGITTYESSNEDVATIDEDGVITIVAKGTVTFTVNYSAGDNYELASATTPELVVEDATLPTIDIGGTNPIVLEATADMTEDAIWAEVVEESAREALDDGEDISDRITVNVVINDLTTTHNDWEDSFDEFPEPPNAKIVYTVIDDGGNQAQTEVYVYLVKWDEPELSLSADKQEITIEAGSEYAPLTLSDFTIDDNLYGSDLSKYTLNLNDVVEDSTEVGTVTENYSVTDISGNESNKVTRTVTIVDTIAPVITLKDGVESEYRFIRGGSFTALTEDDFIITDNASGACTLVEVSNNINPDEAGEYEVVYGTVDAEGNESEDNVSISVIVQGYAPKIYYGDSRLELVGGQEYATELTIYYASTVESVVITKNGVELEGVTSGMTLSDGTYTIVATNPDLAQSTIEFSIRTTGPAILANGAKVKATQWYQSGVVITFNDDIENIARVIIEDKYGNKVVDTNDDGVDVEASYTIVSDVAKNTYYINVVDTLGRVSSATIKVRG